jgi:putative glutamine amidotransferase
MVNSAHGQGIDRLAPGLVVEALSPDGLVEAVRLATGATFTVGVQWHAEWRFDEHPISSALFRAFGEAARARAAARVRVRATQA